MSSRVYLDWNATTPPLPDVLDAMRDAGARTWGNPSSIHGDGRAARAVVEDARAAVGALMDADPRDVVLTSGGTEANNLAVRSAFALGGEEGSAAGVPWLFTSRLEHPSVARVAEALAREGRAQVRWLRVEESGVVDLADLERGLAEVRARGEAIALVTIQAMNHETGVLQPVREAIALAHAAGARVHVDAVQAWGKVDTTAVAAADSASLAAHKLRGPKGIGALVVRAGLPIVPVLLGGAQERGLRPGTVDAALAAGLGVAARHAREGSMRYARIAERRNTLENGLLALPPRVARVAGDPARRAPHVSLLVWPGWQGAELVAALDLEGVSVSSGAACSAGTVEPSPVLEAMLGPLDAASGIRASLGETTTDDDVARALDAFRRVLARGHASKP
ncbi:MAG: cysteine desulfurase [Myxococcales bacterium]|nr:cysteine desulfurase [Myxococcales bacterium]